MTSTEARYQGALEILDRLAAALDVELLARQIDQPIDQATREFVFSTQANLSHRQFLEVVARFLQHLHARAFPNGRQLSMSQAHDEVVALLEQGDSSGGYYEALLEAAEFPEEGLASVLAKVADLLKAQKRDVHVRWVVACHIDPSDWQIKCQMAAILIERCRPWLPPQVADCPPQQMADHVLELIAMDLATRE